jgi:hypothetical protein
MFELFVEYRDDAYRIASIILGLAMLRWGRGPEKAVALIFVGLFVVLHVPYHWLTDATILYDNIDLFHAALDLLAAAGFIAVALYANRNYTLWIAAFQLVALTAHLVSGLVQIVTPLAYAIMVIAPAYFQMIFMAGGLILHAQREKRFGEYREWRGFDPPGLPGLAFGDRGVRQ